MKFTFLSKEFYEEHRMHTEIEQKEDRPYVQVIVEINNTLFAIPMRSNINHKHAFFTDKENKCGLDYSKSVVILDERHELDHVRKPYIREIEFKALLGKEYEVKKGLVKYIRTYKKASAQRDISRNELLCKYSTLQYFEEFI
ncbi:MAG: hypothetical protein IKT25_00660 [Firmicutes bacterium]|nr:hypothetical protein [Bacillota bacterium]MBR6500005.1 hypothetical protein [Bacillota bacterium]